MPTQTSAAPSCDELARLWLDAEERVLTEPVNERFAEEAARLGEEYEVAVRAASHEELLLAWEAAQRLQAAEEIGSRAWGDARRVSELMRTEYMAAREDAERASAEGDRAPD